MATKNSKSIKQSRNKKNLASRFLNSYNNMTNNLADKIKKRIGSETMARTSGRGRRR